MKRTKCICPKRKCFRNEKILRDNFRSDHYIDLAVNILLVKTKEKLILMDTGMGMFADERTGFLLKSLQKAGFSQKMLPMFLFLTPILIISVGSG
jgi:hypothetical protein